MYCNLYCSGLVSLRRGGRAERGTGTHKLNEEAGGNLMRKKLHNLTTLAACCVVAALSMSAVAAFAEHSGHAGKTRVYYIAADEVEWNYAPSGMNEAMGMPFGPVGQMFADPGPGRIGRIYNKAIYRQYTNATFTKLKPRPPQDAYLGLVGPILYAEVGDTIKVVFRNHATHPFGMHPHGVAYAKSSEGAEYNDGATGPDPEGACVPPGDTHVYIWHVTAAAAPGPNDPSSIFWLYHSHCDELRDTASGLVGGIVVTRRGDALPNGHPKGIDREFVTIFDAISENESWYIDYNIEHEPGYKGASPDPSGIDAPLGIVGAVNFDANGPLFFNDKFSINGYIYGNMPMMVMKKGEHVRWYVGSIGDFFNTHTPHWHGNSVLVGGHRVDVIAVNPAQTVTADMVPEDVGIWLYHCHISDHMRWGMSARYEVTGR